MADRIGVISKGEIILVEDKVELMRKLGRKQLTLQLAQPLERIPAELSALPLELSAGGSELTYTYDAHSEHLGHRHAARGPGALRASPSRTCRPSRVRSKTSSSAWSRKKPDEPVRRPRDLPVRDGAHLAHRHSKHHLAGGVHLAVLRGVRLGHRLAHPRGGRRQLRRLHRAGAGDAVAADAKHLQRVVRHLFPEVHRHHLRAAVGAGLHAGDRGELCRRGGHQVDHPGPDHHGHRRAVRADADPAPGLDAAVPGAHRRHLQPAGLHHRHLGRRFREAAVHPDPDHHAADFPGRQLLFDRHAPAVLAEGDPVQPGGLPDQRLSLEFLWRLGRRRRHQPGHDAGCSC